MCCLCIWVVVLDLCGGVGARLARRPAFGFVSVGAALSGASGWSSWGEGWAIVGRAYRLVRLAVNNGEKRNISSILFGRARSSTCLIRLSIQLQGQRVSVYLLLIHVTNMRARTYARRLNYSHQVSCFAPRPIDMLFCTLFCFLFTNGRASISCGRRHLFRDRLWALIGNAVSKRPSNIFHSDRKKLKNTQKYSKSTHFAPN